MDRVVENPEPKDGASQQTNADEAQYNDMFAETEKLIVKNCIQAKQNFELAKELVLAFTKESAQIDLEDPSRYGDLYDDGHYPGEDGDPADL